MKKIIQLSILFAIFLTAFTSFRCVAQTSNELKVIVPFDSLQVDHIAAVGNIKTGVVEITMDFKNNYSKIARVSLGLGGFHDFGITDSKGRNFKLHTDVNTVNTNKGYNNIPFIQFGDKKFNWIATVAQDVPSTESRKLTVRINKVENSTMEISDFHIRCILSVDYGNVGDKMYLVENIKINWK